MRSKSSNISLNSILEKAYNNIDLTEGEILFILEIRHREDLETLFSSARKLRKIHFEDKIFLYGFLYISTYCRNNCSFCFYRSSNSESPRYRKSESEVIEAAEALAESGAHLIDLTMGEDPEIFNNKNNGFEPLISLVKTISERTALPIMISPGVVPIKTLKDFSDAGASWYACYQETYNPGIFKKLRPGQSFEDRLESKQHARQSGLLTEEGVLVGIGETSADLAISIEQMRLLDFDQIRAMNFVPQKGTPMDNFPPPDPIRELLIIALMRHVFPDRLIPATLDVEGLGGLRKRLDAGANVVTSIVPPDQGLAGVAQSSLDINDARRTIEQISPILASCGLQPADPEDFRIWIEKRRNSLKNSPLNG